MRVTGRETTAISVPRCRSCKSRYGAWFAGDTLIGANPMIEFPNHSRRYDQTWRAVRFWGHDGALEATFFIDEGALRRIQPDARPDVRLTERV
jgi:uncharacterized protein DUF1488